MKSFNVLYDPWIPVVYKSGEITELGIRNCLKDAGKIKTIANDYPYEKIAILRLLTAFASDAYQLVNRKDREKLYHTDSFNIEVIDSYINDCINLHNASFDLFDSHRPFMSFAFDKKIDLDETKRSAVYLHLHLPHGDNIIHIVAQTEDQFAGDTPGALLRALLSFYLYPTGNMMKGANAKTGANCYITGLNNNGLPKYKASYGSMGINAGPSMAASVPVFFWPECDTLFHTLVMCMRSENELVNLKLNDPPAPWNTAKVPDGKSSKRGEVVPKVSFVSALTFQPRRVVFETSSDVVKECWISNGYVNADDKLWHDPFAVRLRNHKTNELYYLQADQTRSMWRNVGNLTASKAEDWHIMPDVLQPVKRISNNEKDYENISSLAMVPMTQNAGYSAMIYDDTISLPREFMEDSVLGEYLTSKIIWIESASSCFEELKIAKLQNSKSTGNGTYYSDAVEEYWARMHQYLFDGDNSFINQVLKLYEDNSECFENIADEILIAYMTETVKLICNKEENNTNSWDVLVNLISHTRGNNGVMHKYYQLMKKYKGG